MHFKKEIHYYDYIVILFKHRHVQHSICLYSLRLYLPTKPLYIGTTNIGQIVPGQFSGSQL